MPSSAMQWQTLSLFYPQIKGCSVAPKGHAEQVCIKEQHLWALEGLKMVVAMSIEIVSGI